MYGNYLAYFVHLCCDMHFFFMLLLLSYYMMKNYDNIVIDNVISTVCVHLFS